jgi:hypothetical protein
VATKTKKLSSLQDSQRKHFSFLSVLFLRLDYGSLLPSILVFSNIVWKVFVGRNISFVLFPRKKVLLSFVHLLLSHSSTAKKKPLGQLSVKHSLYEALMPSFLVG